MYYGAAFNSFVARVSQSLGFVEMAPTLVVKICFLVVRYGANYMTFTMVIEFTVSSIDEVKPMGFAESSEPLRFFARSSTYLGHHSA